MKYNFPLFGEWLYDTLRRLRLAHYRICSSAGLGSTTLQRIFRGTMSASVSFGASC